MNSLGFLDSFATAPSAYNMNTFYFASRSAFTDPDKIWENILNRTIIKITHIKIYGVGVYNKNPKETTRRGFQ